MTGGGRQQRGRRAQVGPSRPPTTGYDQVGEFMQHSFQHPI